MLDVADLEYYCYSGVWNAGLFWREWVQCNDRRQNQKHQKTEKKCEKSQEKNKQLRKAWMLTRMGSNFKQKALKRTEEEPQELTKSSPNEVEENFEDISQLSIPILPLSGLNIPADRQVFPCGTFTEIQSAEFCHSPVIIKREKSNSYSEFNILRKEIQVLNQIHHPNILLLMGVVKMDLNVIVTIFEDANNGTLYHLLHQKKTSLSPKEIEKLLTQLCHAMMFLHERGWLHTAITSHSLLITANSTLKLTGFEMARKLDVMQEKDSVTKYLRKQWFQWQSPEQIEGQTKIGTETDIFSAGLISWEMYTNAEPWIGYTYDELLTKYKSLNCVLESEGLPSPFVNSNPKSFLTCMKNMLQINPKRRISCFLEVLSEIHKVQEPSLSTSNLVSDHIQPVHLNGSLKTAHLLFQPQPQRALLASSKQSPQEDRDPYTGLKRVSNSWQKLNTRSPSSKSLDIVNIRSYITSGKEMSDINKTRKYSVTKTHMKNQFPLENSNDYHKKIQNHKIQQTQIHGTLINPIFQRDVTAPFDSTHLNKQKHNIQPPHKLSCTSDTGYHLTRSVPIKPASHLNQRTITYKNNCTKSISKERNIQHGNILCQQLPSGNVSHDKKKWESLVHSKLHHNFHIGHSMKESAEHKTINIQPIEKNTFTRSNKYLLVENNHHHSNNHSDRNQRNQVEAHPNYVHHNHSSKYLYSEEGTCQLRKDHETLNSDTESKDNGFESTDSGIFTISREFDQNILHQMNSTEDLYIDDEFCLEMELDSHMQLLCLFDSTSEFNENFIDEIQSDIIEDKVTD